MSKNLYKIEKCINAKMQYKDSWAWEVNYYEYPKIQEKDKINLIEPIRNLAASMYYTFSKVQYELGESTFIMYLHTRNSKYTKSPNPIKFINSIYDKNPLKIFTDALNKIYPSKRPAFCVISITYPSWTCETCDIAGRPYFPCKFVGGRLPIINSLKTFDSKECQICFKNPSEILFCICGHICMCGICIKIYQSGACPICKTYNEYVRKIR